MIFLLLAWSVGVKSQTSLNPGDIAIVGFNTSTWGNSGGCYSNQDNFAFVPLVDLEAGTEIYFTDNGVKAGSGCLRDNEGKLKYTAPAGGVDKGTIISIYTFADGSCNPEVFGGPGTVADVSTGSAFDLNVSGEQIIVYQDVAGDNCPDNYLFAVSNNVSWDADATDSHTSAIPPGLTNGVNAVVLPKDGSDFQNNARFDCGLVGSGSKEAIMESLVDYNNWEGSDNATYEMPDCAFTFGGVEIEYITQDQISLTWPDPGLVGEEVIFVVKAGSPITIDPSGDDGSSWTVSTNFTVAENIGDNTHVVYKGDGSVGALTITGLTEGTNYYIKTYTHATTSSTWVEGEESQPSCVTAEVQPVTDTTLALNAGDPNGSVDLSWTNYVGTPKADWWDGGTMIVYNEGSAVTLNQAGMNALGTNTGSYSAGNTISGNTVGAIVNSGTPGATSSGTVTGLECGGPYYFAMFHNDGNYWSEAKHIGPITMKSPEIKVLGNSNEITDGDATPTLIDHSDFGILVNGGSNSRTFTIKNIGDGELSISGATLTNESPAGQFSITTLPSSPLSETTGETTLVIDFTPTATGVKTARVQINSDDCDEAIYTFDIKGEAVTGITFIPTCGPEKSIIKVYGSGFTGLGTHGGDYLRIDGVDVPTSDYTVISDTEIEVRVPLGSTTGIIEIDNNGAYQLSAINYTVTENCQQVCP